MLKLANPFYYPLAILGGGIILVVGVRLGGVPNFIILPTSAIIATVGASVLKAREPDPEKIAKKQLEEDLKNLQVSSRNLANKAELLRQEANQFLAKDADKLDLLISVQEVCDRALELPHKIEEMAKQLPQKESLLSVNELEQELIIVRQKLHSSSEITHQHLTELVNSLERNIQLAKTGKDTRQVQLLSLYKVVQDSGGILQQFQNQLRRADLDNAEAIQELENLSQELKTLQDNMDIFIH